MITGKYNIEINFVGDGRIFVNYWDYNFGRDVIAEYVGGQLYDDNEEITFADFMDNLTKTISEYPEQKPNPSLP